ncbi:NADPH-dependent oxidoreductase [Malaciobacter canalis]|uniref:NADPH-dependent oxidoreductase n=1 Tax=Malaciobacter canalis TaxID=1912871 RepID=A0ABX4LMZ0_9BACT|nr:MULTISPECIES: nitroreductase family protein [Malaciobacter]PHO09244.1 NADPH-dependent oxidoreductase [Malaciobacter canalis]PHO11943.1 NADPH-dependent oxidoreductase [Malaciobacter marinus]QEE31557.1 nitroreductase [Malaciobacter canalis]
MNEILEQLLNRKSIRNFTGESVKEEDLKLIFEAAQRAPTSVNGQQVSIVYTKDKEKLKQISELCAGQEHIKNCEVFVMFVIDYNRTAYALETINQKQMIQESAEGIIVGSVDAGIMLSTLQTAARSLGYGTTAIGAVRLSVEKFIEILELPKNTYPLVGSTIGVPTKEALQAPLKPRIPFDSFVFEDKYDDKKAKDGVEAYETILSDFRKANGMNYKTSYKEEMARFYTKSYTRDIKNNFEKQGFIFKDNK